ncbi:MAG TPA: type II secretion system F family protein [Thermoleophilaceae bacterium]|nr:type II secretion system F family protein [Thermoleophilaceae bacterium]
MSDCRCEAAEIAVTAAALAFAATVLTILGLALLAPDGRARGRPRGQRRRAARGPAAIRALARFGGAAARRAAPQDLERRIEAAGRPGGLEPRELMAAKLAGVAVAALPGALLGAAAPGRLGLLVVVAAPVAGFFAPDLWLARQAAARATAARRQLPELLELLRVTVDAGVSLAAALAAVGARADGPVADEWRAVGGEVALGVPLGEALAEMRRRLPLPEVGALVAALDRARRHGAPLSATLAGQARDARLALRRRVQEDAARAGPKIQLVVALLLVPSVLLLVAAALASALLGSGGTPLP